MPRFLQYTFAGVILGLLVGVPWAYASWRRVNYRNVHVVREGVLYRSGQLTQDGLSRLIHDHGIKTVITLRFAPDPKDHPPDLQEERYCRHIQLRHYRIRHKAWSSIDRSVPAEKNIEQFMRIMSNPDNHPVLVHCFAGIHRTGTFCALYRMEFEAWSNEDAIQEMRDLGYVQQHDDVFAFMENYRPRGYRVARDAVTKTPVPGGFSVRQVPRYIPPATTFPLPAELQELEDAQEAVVQPQKPSEEPPVSEPEDE